MVTAEQELWSCTVTAEQELWSCTVTAEQELLLPDWEGRSHTAGGFMVSIVGGQ